VLAHIAGVPVEESLLYLAPVIIVVGWMYFAGWRERRRAARGRGGPSDGSVEPRTGEDRRPADDEPAQRAGRAPAPDERNLARRAPARHD
jgi:hypothetical protein